MGCQYLEQFQQFPQLKANNEGIYFCQKHNSEEYLAKKLCQLCALLLSHNVKSAIDDISVSRWINFQYI